MVLRKFWIEKIQDAWKERSLIWLSGVRINAPIAIECKLTQSEFNVQNMISFRKQYPIGENFVVANDVDRSLSRKYNIITIRFVNLKDLIKALKEYYGIPL